jgi:hypothetical protein
MPRRCNIWPGLRSASILGNSAYPEAFEVDHETEFDSDLGELTVAVIVPAPSAVPNVKAFRYVAAPDEIRETACTQKEQRDRYNGAVASVALRSFHEVFKSAAGRSASVGQVLSAIFNASPISSVSVMAWRRCEIRMWEV